MPLTRDQELAVTSRGGARLVSAAAGSGKTRVLVERLMRYVDDGYDIDRFLVVTFTRAAAGEMRSRILSALNERIAARPGDRRLRRQTELCCRAPIGTIDSICGTLLRQNAHAAHIAPDFKVIEPDRAETILAAALDDLMEGVYETIGEDPGRRALVDSFGAGRDDAALTALIRQLHSAVQSHAHPAQWLREKRLALRCAGAGDVIETEWGRCLLARTASQADYWAGRMDCLLRAMAGPEREPLRRAYAESVAVTAEGLRAMAAACAQSWEAARRITVAFPKLRAYRGDDPLAGSVKTARDECKAVCRRWASLLADDSASLLAELENARPALDALLELTEKLEEAFAQRKRRQGVVDFSDQEHMVLTLLEDEDTGLAAALSDRYAEVLVDEYQDVNACQDALFRLLSDGGRKLFMVGDVKQSIYRFRLADPSIFLEKYRGWPAVTDALAPGEPGKILLRENFRSRPEILSAANHVFSNLMSPELGELTYDDDAALRPGLPAEGEGPKVCFTMLDLAGDEEDRPDRIAREAAYVADSIRSLIDGGAAVTGPDGVRRRAGYGDIAILLRSHKGAAERYRTALEARSIPSVSQQGGGFFRSLEITVLLSLLAVIDNPRQDVALISAIRSPLYGFTADDLADIRRYDRDADFYTALTLSAAERADSAAFLAELEEYRNLAPDLSVEALLGRICEKRDLYALLSAMPDGETRRENVRALTDYARTFEQDGYRGLFRFLNWMQRLEQRGEEPRTGCVERRDAVQIITIHHAKGLEYPIVFLAGTNRRFNKSDLRSPVLVHPRLGVGGKVVDAVRGARYPSLAWRAIAAVIDSETLSEEMRVLYVAMTRAKERLYISGAWPDAAKALSKLREGLDSPLPPELLLSDGSPGTWLARAAQLPGSPLDFRVVPSDRPAAESASAPAAETAGAAKAAETPRPARWTYPMAWASALPSKLTASGLEGTDSPDADAVELSPGTKRRATPRRPRLTPETTLTAAEKGTAVHTALQFIDFARCGSPEGIRAELARMEARGHLTAAQAAAVDPELIRNFFRSNVGRRVLKAEKIWRELRFSLLFGAEEFFDVPPGEQIMVQGVVDCCFLADGALTIVDYKTDHVTPDTLAARTAEYAPQLRVYAGALERLLSLPVREGVLFFLRSGREARIPLAPERGGSRHG